MAANAAEPAEHPAPATLGGGARRRVLGALLLIGGVPVFLLVWFLTRQSSNRILPIGSLVIVGTMTLVVVALASRLLLRFVEDLVRIARAVQEVLPAVEGREGRVEGDLSVDRILARLRRSMEELERKARRLEESNLRLQELDRMKSEFLSSVSHELRTPLTSIRSFSEILLNYPDETPETRARFLRIINEESERLTNLINSVLDLAKIEAGRVAWNLSPVRIEEVLSRAADAVSGVAKSRNILVVLEVAGPLPEVFGDRERLQQVAVNLLGNAVKFSSGDAEVALRAGKGPGAGELFFAVTDRGPGIPAAQMHRLFGKFEQIQDPRGGAPVGTGLGLAISKEIAEVHGGRIGVETEEGKGSTFRVVLPVWDRASEFQSYLSLWVRQAERRGLPVGVLVMGIEGRYDGLDAKALQERMGEVVRSNTDRVVPYDRAGFAAIISFSKRFGMERIQERVVDAIGRRGLPGGPASPGAVRSAVTDYPREGKDPRALTELLERRLGGTGAAAAG